jgi:long-chain acyl-CoA synthetase
MVAGTDLRLNGAGLRKKFGLVSVYVAALYLTAQSHAADAIITDAKPRRLLMVMKRSVEPKSLMDALHDSIKDNSTAAELEKIGPALAKLDQLFQTLTAKESDRIALDISADGGLNVLFNDQPKEAIAGPDIGPAMLRIWLGQRPAQDDLKASRLGG